MPPAGRKFTPMTINKFKGMNTGFLGSSSEQYSQEDEELADITNFNIATDGYLEKRQGTSAQAIITTPYAPNYLRLLLLQRTRVGPLANRIFVTNGTDTWRIGLNGGPRDRLTVAGASMTGLMSIVEYGGANAAESYNCTGVRLDLNASDPIASGGIVGIYGDTTTNSGGWVSNTPMGTQIIAFKNHGWVINSFGANYPGATYSTHKGDETKVWYSNPGNLGDFGGAGAPNNFSLDFGDGDICTSMVIFNDQLVIFKARKTFVVSADGNPTDWQQRLVSDRIGCVGRGTAKVINGIIYFLSADGVMRTDGTTFQNISAPVRDFLWQYDAYVDPKVVTNLYASYWEHKYILWLPDETQDKCTRALVYDIRTEIWTKWDFVGGVQPYGEAVWDEHYPSTLLLGSWYGNSLWQMAGSVAWTDNSTKYDCTFTTKKYDLGSVMKRKRNHFAGLSVVDNYINRGTYKIDITADDTTTTTRTEATFVSQTTMNIKAKGAGYGRYFQVRVTQNSSQYAAVYDLTLMNEDRGYEQRSMPSQYVVAVDPTRVFNMGPDAQDKLDAGMKMG